MESRTMDEYTKIIKTEPASVTEALKFLANLKDEREKDDKERKGYASTREALEYLTSRGM